MKCVAKDAQVVGRKRLGAKVSASPDLRMANSAEDLWIVPGCRWCRAPSQGTLLHLEAAKHGVDAMDVLTALFACAP